MCLCVCVCVCVCVCPRARARVLGVQKMNHTKKKCMHVHQAIRETHDGVSSSAGAVNTCERAVHQEVNQKKGGKKKKKEKEDTRHSKKDTSSSKKKRI
jgi:hypothetical protein